MKNVVVKYELSDDAWNRYEDFIRRLIDKEDFRTVCEIGGGANPLLHYENVVGSDLRYIILDSSQEELQKAPDNLEKICVDILEATMSLEGRFDMVFSKMLAEHVKDGKKFHQNSLRLLRPGGYALHFFPTLYAPPYVINQLVPARLSEILVHLIQDGREKEGKVGKFPAYYSWCRGPSALQIKRFKEIGYEVEQYVGFFGHSGYYSKLPAIVRLHRFLSNWLIHHPIPWLTSFAYVVLRKPM